MKNKINKVLLSGLIIFSVTIIGCTSSRTTTESTLSQDETKLSQEEFKILTSATMSFKLK